ncbi:chemotaxis protein CheB [Deinococcus sp. YIM 77859]|uniref:chemotaxis protein CheB n=1 Tax=Deinococcus sp. YIM 77859 TaxID=1540221 RepID=UPI0005512C9D|nr:chemotaxis protein CheB [Deinococcus sp. YIM 77859]
MTRQPIVVIGASAGGVEALQALASRLPTDFPAPVLMVLHIAPYSPSVLPDILNRCCALPAQHAQDGETAQPGRIYVAPPDHHLLVENGELAVTKGPRENRMRPAIDTLFRSAAYTHGPDVTGVILSGLLDDGTSGLWTIKRLGGQAIVQDPGDARFDAMPRSAIQHVAVDAVLSAAQIGEQLSQLVRQPRQSLAVQLEPHEHKRLRAEVRIAAQDSGYELGIMNCGKPSLLTCPECHGTLTQIQEGTLTRYRCHTGHAYTASSLLADITSDIEEKAYQVLRALEESAILLRQLGGQCEQSGNLRAAQAFLVQAHEAEEHAQTVHNLIIHNKQLSSAKVEEAAPRE